MGANGDQRLYGNMGAVWGLVEAEAYGGYWELMWLMMASEGCIGANRG